jgi:NAD(P)-dependent dehydrogenase (short-subunit alcohol dehydrogenase family)
MVFDRFKPGQRLELNRIHRQEADNPILDLAHALGDPDLTFERFERMIEDAAARDDRIRIAPRADSDMMARSPVLVWRNATRIRLITAFRAAHGAPEDQLIPGEPLLCDGIELPLKHRKRRIDLEARGLIKGAPVIYLGPGNKDGFSRLHVIGAESPRLSAASIVKIEKPGEEEPFIPFAARMGATFLHGAAVTIHKAQGSQWPEVQVFAPDLYAAARSGRMEAGQALWKRLAYVAITRAEERLIWVTRYMLSKPQAALGIEDLKVPAAPLALEREETDMKTAIVTGASAGIGRAVAERMLAAGWHVGLVARRADLLHELADPYEGKAVALPLDVTDADAVQVAFHDFAEDHGRIDCLFNNAGIFTPAAPLDEIAVEDWRRAVDVNLTGMFLCARMAFRIMRRQAPQGGRIINNGSISAHVPREGAAPYTATKHAITGLTRQIALDGRPFDIACGQIDIGNAETDLLRGIAEAARARGEDPPPMMDVAHVADAVLAMAELPLSANTLFQTIMATKMPYVGRG